ncbi:MAG: hypothetical protein JO143_13510 [Acetobacteraceae bacterium]|nr:hypothetical protein [Acetobacteraceae bacterium]
MIELTDSDMELVAGGVLTQIPVHIPVNILAQGSQAALRGHQRAVDARLDRLAADR